MNTGDGALAINLPREEARAVDGWRVRYDPNFAAIRPHITLAYPFRVLPAEWPNRRGALAELFAGFAPIAVRLEEVSCFTAPSRVLWLKPESGGEIERLRHALEQRFPELVPPDALGYVAHATLGFFATDEALEQARRTVQAAQPPLRFVAAEAAYLAYTAVGKWELQDKLRFGNI